MSLKLIIFVVGFITFVSCTNFEKTHRQLQHEIQSKIVREQKEKIREHHQLENYQRNEQLRQLEEQRRMQEQINFNYYNSNLRNSKPTSVAHHYRLFNNFDNLNYYAVVPDDQFYYGSRFGNKISANYAVEMQRLVRFQPTIFASTLVSKSDDGQQSDYMTATSSNF